MRKEAHKIIKMEIKRSFTVDQVWDILGNRYGEAHLWATGLYHAEGYGAPQLEGATCSKRACDTSQGKIKEAIRSFDAKNYHLAYEVIEGFPGFVKKEVNNWRLTPNGKQTQVDIHFIAETQGFLGIVMGPCEWPEAKGSTY